MHRLASVDEFELHGRARDLSGTGILWVFAGLGLAGLPPFTSFLGEAAIEESAEKAGHAWIWMVFLVAAVLTAGAVFRIGGRVFRGWGLGEDSETGGAEKIEEAPETEDAGSSEHRIPPEMFGPAAVLAVLAVAIGLTPSARHATQAAATRMADAAGYQAIVLDHAVLPVNSPPVEHVFPTSSVLRSLVTALLALALAGYSLSPYWPRKKSAYHPVKAMMMGLRQLHCGHVGDYVALLTLGVAVFGVALSVLIKLGF